MLALLLQRKLEEYWVDLDITVEEGIDELGAIYMEDVFVGKTKFQNIPIPNQKGKKLLEKAKICLPSVLPDRTASVHTKKKLNCAGILVMMILYSVNLRIMGQANISLLSTSGILSSIEKLGINSPQYLWRLSILPGTILMALCYLAATRLGLFLRATGDNEFMVRRQGVNTDWPVFIGLGLSNMLVAFCGALVAQSQGFADVNMGVGLIITGLAALIIGETAVDILSLVKNKLFSGQESRFSLLPWRTFKQLSGAFIGCLLYFFIISICLRIGLAPTDLKLATGALVILGVASRFKRTSVETYIRSEW